MRVREIVRSLRSFSRLDESDLKAVNIHDGLDSALMILQPTFGVQTPPIKIHRCYGDLPLVECHAREINQAFVNILENAAWALKEADSPEITIYTEVQGEQQKETAGEGRRERGDRHIVVKISDNGIGIPPAAQSKIFDPFFTTKPVGQGTGLGLSTCYQTIVETHRGQLQCHSTLGEGTQLVIVLPIEQLSKKKPGKKGGS